MRIRLVVAGLAVVALVVGCGDDSESSGGSATATPETTAPPSTVPVVESSSTTTSTGPLSDASAEFAAAIEQAGTLTYRARYEGESQADDGSVRTTVVEVWRRPPLARRDTTARASSGELRVREHRTENGIVACFDLSEGNTGEYQCRSVGPDESIDPAAPTFEAVNPAGGPVEVVDDEIAGVALVCYRVTALRAQEVCFDGDDIPVVVDDGALRLVRTAVDRQVTDADLAPPA
ncbi:MAG: hypothetical protein ACRD0G_08665 [Acidimicrobiales bacterium]